MHNFSSLLDARLRVECTAPRVKSIWAQHTEETRDVDDRLEVLSLYECDEETSCKDVYERGTGIAWPRVSGVIVLITVSMRASLCFQRQKLTRNFMKIEQTSLAFFSKL